MFALLVLLPLGRSSDPGSHSRLFSPFLITVRALHFYREKDSALSTLVNSRRIAPTHAISYTINITNTDDVLVTFLETCCRSTVCEDY